MEEVPGSLFAVLAGTLSVEVAGSPSAVVGSLWVVAEKVAVAGSQRAERRVGIRAGCWKPAVAEAAVLAGTRRSFG